MMESRQPSMVYQYGLSVRIALVAVAFSSQSPAYASIMLTGAATMLAAVFDRLLFNKSQQGMPKKNPLVSD